ncbi:MAG: hypothetical protein ACQCN3_07330 [Candidatus Bathyarchaeia archaeon]
MAATANYASQTNLGWDTKIVNLFESYSFVLDVENFPHVLYSGIDGLTYASWSGQKWVSQVVDPDGATFGQIALDSFGNPQVAYVSGQSVRYASWTGSNWTIHTVDSGSDFSLKLSFSLDFSDTPFIMYTVTNSVPSETGNYWSTDTVKLAVLKGSSWSFQTVLSDVGGFGNMVLDSAGNPHFTYATLYPALTGIDNQTISYASWDGTTWENQKVVSNVRLVSIGELALDSHDFPHVAYITDKGLMYTRWRGTGWSTLAVNNTVPPRWPCYLALDSSDNPHISYLGVPYNKYGGVYISLIYATTNTTNDITPIITPDPTQTTASVFTTYLSFVIPSVTIGVIAVVVIVWKKRTPSFDKRD